MECQHCHSDDPQVVKKYRVNQTGRTRLYCEACQKTSNKVGAPNILLLDIETSKAKYELYGPGKQYVSWKQEIEPIYILGWAAKTLFSPDIQSCFVTPAEARARDDRRVIKKIHKLMSKADLIIAHNGDGFDIPMLTAYFSKYDLPPINRFLTVDTYKKSKQIFRLPSCSLGYLLKFYGFAPKGHREDTDLAERGDKKALAHDEQYCRDDVLGMEELYLKIRPYFKTHPNMWLYYEKYQMVNDNLKEGETCCRVCGDVIARSRWSKLIRTPSGNVYRSCSCPHCGTVLRGERA